MADEEFFLHLGRMNRLTRALKAPLEAWEAEVLRRTRDSFGEAMAQHVRFQLDKAFIELVTMIDGSIVN
jgi:hypothetical protein